MKIRKGFVSNSSSSSFIVATDSTDNAVVEITIKVDIAEYANNIIRSKEELDAYFINNYSLSYMKTLEDIFSDNYYGEQKRSEYNKCLNAIENGKVIIMGSFTNEGDSAEYFLAENGLPKNLTNIEIIHNEAGF